MTTGVIYARVSSIGDRQSTERQVKDLSEYAKYKGIEIRKVFEEHISGARGYSIRDVAKLSGKGVSTVQRVKRLIKVQSQQ